MFKVLLKSLIRQNAEWQAKFETLEEAQAWLAKQKLKADRKDQRYENFSKDEVPEEAIETEEVRGSETDELLYIKCLMPAQATYEIIDITAEKQLENVLKKRILEYGPIGAQLDLIFHEGLEAWKAKIQLVKNNNPKPE